MRPSRSPGLIAAAVALFGLVAVVLANPAGVRGENQSMPLGTVSPAGGAVGAWVFTDQPSYQPGSLVIFTLVVLNKSDEDLSLQRRSGQVFDFEVLREGKVAWNWAHGRFFTMALGAEILPPGIPRVYTVIWDRRDNAGEPVGPGLYEVRARYKPGLLDTEPAAFELR